MNTSANTNLKVPFAEKDQAKSLGARWNGELKVWYVPAGVDATPFAKWLDGAAASSTSGFSTSSAPKKAAAKSGAASEFLADNAPPQSHEGLSAVSEDADMDAINAKLRDAFDAQDADAF